MADILAFYLRLSLMDGDVPFDQEKLESDSISNQRDLLSSFITQHPEWRNMDIREYVDDGFTGTKFNRPAFERMIEDARNGMVKIILVKDLSRLGRDYVELGDYMEQILPFLGVRLLSVNDHYDSDMYIGTTGGFDVVMRNILYSYYSRDLSKKVRSTMQFKWRQGLYTQAQTPFGYLKDPDNKYRLVVDPDAAAVVRVIFNEALAGTKPKEIANILNDRGVPTPVIYNKKKEIKSKHNFKQCSAFQLWDGTKVRVILRNRAYTGAVVMGKMTSAPCSGQYRPVPESQQYIHEDMHEAIVSKTEFKKIQAMYPTRSNASAKVKDYPLRGLVRCPNCGKAMTYRNEYEVPFFRCESGYYTKTETGCNHDRIIEKDLNITIWKVLQNVLQLLNSLDKQMKKRCETAPDQTKGYLVEIQKYQQQIKMLQTARLTAYEKFTDHKLSKEQYLSEKKWAMEEIQRLELIVMELDRKAGVARNDMNGQLTELIETAKQFKNTMQLTRQLASAFIKCIYIENTQSYWIEWKYADLFTELLGRLVERY